MSGLDFRYFPLILNAIEECVFTIDRDGRITSFNRSAEDLSGYKASEVIGKQCASVFRTPICETACPLKSSIDSGQRISGQSVRIRARDGRFIPVSVTTSTLRSDGGEILGGLEIIRNRTEVEDLQRKLDSKYRVDDIISRNAEMQALFRLLPAIAESDSTVLVLGASGTGKELLAKAIHNHSPRRDSPFVAVNCAAMPETLMESELFGYVKGAFTDARQNKPGRIAQADGGTLFLDEVGDLPLSVQVKLLRFLQERSYEPLGATFTVRADVRIVCATHRDLSEMVGRRLFREDLYFRINVMQLQLPALCRRSEDIPLLLRHFIQRFNHVTGKRIERVDDEALAALVRYPFPGNIRELENIVERAFILCGGPVIYLDHLPPTVVAAQTPQAQPTARAHPGRAGNSLEAAERAALQEVLRRHDGNRTLAAEELGIHRATLHRKIRRYGLR